MDEVLIEARKRFLAPRTYRADLRVQAGDGVQLLHYAYRRPGWVRMELVQPHHGVVLVFDPLERRVRLWPFGLAHGPSLSLSPDHRLVRGPRGHRIDRSDVGALFDNLIALGARGSVGTVEEGGEDAQASRVLEVIGDAGAAVAGVHRYRLRLATDSLFPQRVQSFATSGRPIETVDFEAVELDVELPDHLFRA